MQVLAPRSQQRYVNFKQPQATQKPSQAKKPINQSKESINRASKAGGRDRSCPEKKREKQEGKLRSRRCLPFSQHLLASLGDRCYRTFWRLRACRGVGSLAFLRRVDRSGVTSSRSSSNKQQQQQRWMLVVGWCCVVGRRHRQEAEVSTEHSRMAVAGRVAGGGTTEQTRLVDWRWGWCRVRGMEMVAGERGDRRGGR